MLFNIIGAGRLGKHIAKALSMSGKACLAGVYNSHLQSSKEAIECLGAGKACAYLDELPVADILFITTPDDTISSIVNELTTKRLLQSGTAVIHCSGAKSSALLSSLKMQQCHIASFHPLRAFCYNHLDSTIFSDCYCTMEGDSQALQRLDLLFTPLGAKLITIDSDKKTTYHAAAVIASNYLVTLAALATDLLQQSGINQLQAQAITESLMQASLNNVITAPTIASALTGPLARGDITTINAHLKALDHPSTQLLYKAAGLATLPLTTLQDPQKIALEAIFQSV